jgi:hypothetical protein
MGPMPPERLAAMRKRAAAKKFAASQKAIRIALNGGELKMFTRRRVIEIVTKQTGSPTIIGTPQWWITMPLKPGVFTCADVMIRNLHWLPTIKAVVYVTPKTESIGGITIDLWQAWSLEDTETRWTKELRRAVYYLTRGNAYGWVLTAKENALLDEILTEYKERSRP